MERYSRLLHTVDPLQGRLRPGFDAFDAFLTHMWAVTVTGAPKTWAMQFIEDHENTPRRWYGGAGGPTGLAAAVKTRPPPPPAPTPAARPPARAGPTPA